MFNLEKPGDKITNPDTINGLTQLIFAMFKDNLPNLTDKLKPKKFPGGHPVSFTSENFLRRVNYLVCEKSDGVRYLLFLQSIPNLSGVVPAFVYLIDRKFEFWKLRLKVPGSLLQGHSLFDCELVMDYKTDPTILVFDTLFAAGTCYMNNSYHDRLRVAWQEFVYPLRLEHAVNQAGVNVFLKDFFHMRDTQFLWTRVCTQLPHTSDGLIFTRDDAPYMLGTNPHILKWKPPELNSVDFLLKPSNSPNSFLMFTRQRGLVEFGEMTVTDPEAVAELTQHSKGVIAECVKQNGQWTLHKVRTDKSQPNNTHVTENIEQSIRENLGFDKLLDIVLGT